MPHTQLSSTSAAQKAAVYAASCNPPRKAKRLRVDSVDSDASGRALEPAMRGTSTAPTPTGAASAVRIRPAPSTSSAPAILPMLPAPTGEVSAPGPKKRGRKPGAMSRSARETQRKINHSRIEKARRSKINDALDALRTLVPPDVGKERLADDDLEQSSKPGNKKEDKEREFKLDILERTVLFVQDLMEKVSRLERGQPSTTQCTCHLAYSTKPSKRKLVEVDDDGLSELSDVDEDASDGEVVERSSRPSIEPQPRNARAGDHVRLPSISNLLNHTPVELPPFSRSGTRSAHNSPYAPFGAHIFSATNQAHSPASAHPANSASVSRRASTSSSVQGVSPSFHPHGGRGHPREMMSPLALGLPSPPASGSTNPYLAHEGPPPTLKLPSPRSSPPEIRKVPLPPSRTRARGAVERSKGNVNDNDTGVAGTAPRWQPTSPSWTREDESAASLLLQISSTSSNSRSSSNSTSPPVHVPAPSADPVHAGQRRDAPEHAEGVIDTPPLAKVKPSSHAGMEAQTPGRLLGILTKLA